MSAGEQQPIGSGFGPKTEPDEIMADIDLAGKTAVVTGGYSGIGLETTRALIGAGAKVIVPVRSKTKAEEQLKEAGLSVETGEMDLGDLNSVRKFANDVLAAHPQIDLLINNAGIMACPETRTGKDWEAQFATNHIGHFVLTNALEPALKKNGARVVCLSSLAHKRSPIRWEDIHYRNGGYDKWEAYGQAKTANALFARDLNRRWSGDGVKAFSVHPGGIVTPLQRHLDQEEMIAMGWLDENGELSELAKNFFKTPAQGCTTTLWCAVSPALETHGGEYCEDCDIAQLATEDSPQYFHVAPHAVDNEAAARLWDETEKMLES